MSGLSSIVAELSKRAATGRFAKLKPETCRQIATAVAVQDDLLEAVDDILEAAVSDIEHQLQMVREQLVGVDDPDEVDAALGNLDDEIADIMRKARRECQGAAL
jgi:hypothetical protein